MSIITFPGFHTCSQNGGYESVRSGIPFISDNSEDQWLTQGFYFWSHSAKFAKKWIPAEYRGKNNKTRVKRAIGEFELSLHQDSIWDLVGNSRHHEELEQFSLVISRKYAKSKVKKREPSEISVNEIVSEMRCMAEKGEFKSAFPYIAVKAVDNRIKDVNFYSFTASGKETIKLPIGNAQQICIFKKEEGNIKLKSFLEPHEYKMRFIQECQKEETSA